MKKLLLVKGKAGLGNRILCALTAILYAKISRRTIIFDWRDELYSNDGTNAFPRLFKTPENTEDEIPEGCHTISPQIWRDRLDWTVARLIGHENPRDLGSFRAAHKYSIDPSIPDYPEDIAVYWAYREQIASLRRHFRGRFADLSGLNDFQILRSLTPHLTPVDAIQRKVSHFRAAHFNRPVIGAHVRYTDLKVPLDRFLVTIDGLLKSVPHATVFLATDSPIPTSAFRERFHNVVMTSKDFPEDGRALHSNTDCKDKIGHGVGALIDMLLLADADYMVYSSRSSFSLISHLLSQRPEARNIDVDRFNILLKAKRLAQRYV